jgi:beta-galactosidase
MSRFSQITRREFLKSSSLAAAAAFTGVLLPQSLLAMQSTGNVQRLSDGWEFHRGALGGIWEAWGGNKGSDSLPWQAVAMPHCFNAHDSVDPDEHYYQGPGWYRTRLKPVNPFVNGRTLLYFEGAGQKTEVFVAGEKVGRHVGGYDEFIVDVTDAAQKALRDPANNGQLPVAVLCDNSRDLELSPSFLSDFSLYGGLYRPVNLVYVPAVSLGQVHVRSELRAGGRARVSIEAALYNPVPVNSELRLTIRALGPDGAAVHSSEKTLTPWTGQLEMASFEVVKPQLWSPSNPALYHFEVTLNSEHGNASLVGRFGIRSFEFVANGPFKLNGERLLLKGTSRHEDHAGLASAMPEDLVRREMTLIKAMGANFIRLGHYQQSRVVLDLCDELGLLVWEEIPWCRSGVGSEASQQQLREMLRDMIGQHFNHPSVIVWGLSNEIDWPGEYPEINQEKIRVFLKELHDLAHKLDATRVTGIRRADFCKDIPDVFSPTMWPGWYRGRYTEYKSTVEKEAKEVNRLIHLEWGSDSHARRHSELPDQVLSRIDDGTAIDPEKRDEVLSCGISNGSRTGDWSETYACNLFDWILKEQETMPWLTGSAQWAFKDFATPLRSENPVPRVNQKGLVERDLTPKEGYYVFRSYWTDKPMAHIYGHSWPVRWGEANEPKLVKVYSNCDSAELFLNGKSCGVKKRDSQNFPAAGLRWHPNFSPGENHLRVVARKNGTTVTDEIRFNYQTQTWAAPARIVLSELGRRGDVITLEARLMDSQGVQCLDRRDRVRFGLQGDGTLLDNLGTSTGSRVLELYNGRAEVSMTRKSGRSVASASCPGVPTAFLTID